MNKRSVALDIKTPEGRQTFLRLVESADANVNNLRGDLPARLKIDYASLKATKPSIVCLHISAYGRTNSRAAWPGYDYLMQAESGLMSITGEPDRPPSRIGQSMIDYMTGVTGTVGLLSCVIRARATGQGCDVDTCLFDVATHQLAYSGTWFLNTGDVPVRQPRSSHPSLVPVQTVRTADGWIYIMCMKDKFWDELLSVLDRPELKDDPRFATQAARSKHRGEVTAALDEAMPTRPTAAWLAELAGTVPVAPIYDVGEAFANPFMAEADMVRTAAHPARSDLRVLANPIQVDERMARAPCAALGAHTDDLVGPAEAEPLRGGA